MTAGRATDRVPIRLVTPNVAFEQRLRGAFGHALNGELHHVRAVRPDHLDPLLDTLPDAGVVAIGPAVDVEVALELAARIDQARPDLAVLLLAEPSPALLRSALRVGVRDVVTPEASDEQLREAFTLARRVAANWHDHLGSGDQGRVITVRSPKGGSGKTTIATNLAVGLAADAPDEVVLVDLDSQFGDVASALQLAPEHTTRDAVRVAHDPTLLKVYLTAHPSGLYALCAPDDPAHADDLEPARLAEVVATLREEFRWVVVDTGSGLDDAALAAIELSTDLVLLATMDVPSVRGLGKELAALDALAVPARRHLVINRADAKVGLSVDDVAATIGMPVDVTVPSSRVVPVSTNVGVPLVTGEPHAPVTRSIQELIDRFAERPAERPANGLLAWLRR